MDYNENWLDSKFLAFHGCNRFLSCPGHESIGSLTIIGHNWPLPLIFPMINAEGVILALNFWKTKKILTMKISFSF